MYVHLNFFARFTGHKNHDYKIDSALNCEDTHVISGSEDGLVYYWDLVEVQPMCSFVAYLCFYSVCEFSS